MAHHRGKAKRAINEAATMDEAVKKAIELVDTTNTLIVVTSDHSHTLSINGYAKRGSNIFSTSNVIRRIIEQIVLTGLFIRYCITVESRRKELYDIIIRHWRSRYFSIYGFE